MSSERFIIFETLIPGAGSNSFRVTTGPWLTFFILPSTPKSKRIFSKKAGSLFSLLLLSAALIGIWAYRGKHKGILLLQFFYASAGIIGMIRWF